MKKCIVLAFIATTLCWAPESAQAAVIAFDDVDGGETGFAAGSTWGNYSIVSDLGFSNNLKAVSGVIYDFGEVNILAASDGTQLATNVTGRIYDVDNTWREVSTTLPPEALTNVILEFTFQTDFLEDTPRAGWYIDAVTIR